MALVSCSHDATSIPPPIKSSAPVITPPVVSTTPPITPPCRQGMVLSPDKTFCIDQYEWPNQKGVYPDFAMTAFEAENNCRSVGKRLCTHKEWVRACRGKANLTYGYGNTWNSKACNDDNPGPYQAPHWEIMLQGHAAWKAWAKTLYKGVPSGSMESCSVDEGDGKIYDMIGNVREWVKNPNGNGGYDFESSFWYGTMQGPLGCGFEVTVHSPGFASYEVGTRCCSEVQ